MEGSGRKVGVWGSLRNGFVHVQAPENVGARVWERGSREAVSCCGPALWAVGSCLSRRGAPSGLLPPRINDSASPGRLDATHLRLQVKASCLYLDGVRRVRALLLLLTHIHISCCVDRLLIGSYLGNKQRLKEPKESLGLSWRYTEVLILSSSDTMSGSVTVLFTLWWKCLLHPSDGASQGRGPGPALWSPAVVPRENPWDGEREGSAVTGHSGSLLSLGLRFVL